MSSSDTPGIEKSMIFAVTLGLLLTISNVVPARDASHVSRWVHTGFHMHQKSYEDERVVLNLRDNSTFEINYIGYFENDDDTTWEKNIEASGNYQIIGNEIVFRIEVLLGTEDREKPRYGCPFTLNKKAFSLSKCALLNINLTYQFKRTDPEAFHFQ